MSLRGGEWFFDRRAQIGDLIEQYKDDEVIVNFLKDEKDRMCMKCKFWDERVGHYDSGNMSYCKNPKISGNHHPSNGCGMYEQTLVYSPQAGRDFQEINTRWNFGCNLWEKKNG